MTTQPKVIGLYPAVVNEGTRPTLSKQDEIDFLLRVAVHVEQNGGHNIYLGSLFTNAMVEWVQARIMDDVSPDLYARYREVQAELQETKAMNERQVSLLENVADKHLSEVAGMKESFNSHVDDIMASWNRDKEKLRDGHDAFNQLAAEYARSQGQLKSMGEDLAASALEVQRLKAMIFDLEHPAA